jgi:dihydroorotate dehydrogenase
MYKLLIRPLLFCFSPEKIHHITFAFLKFTLAIPLVSQMIKAIFKFEHPSLEKKLFGLHFKNPIGLAAGFDKNAQLIDELACFGFGFIEIGTLTPKPQAGNPKPRLFRLKKDKAVINRMGFNNEGVANAVKRLKKRTSKVIVGGNIGKNKTTPNENAIDDYVICFHELFEVVDYFVVNVSSPNTPNLRDLQEKEPLQKLLQTLQDLNQTKPKPKPILLKIAPDLSFTQLDEVIEVVLNTKIAGVIATNTTISRENLATDEQQVEKIGAGGLSGKPVKDKSTAIIRYLKEKSQGAFPIIGVGGIQTTQDALEKLEAGADLVQIYTGFVYEGPEIVKKIKKGLRKRFLI